MGGLILTGIPDTEGDGETVRLSGLHGLARIMREDSATLTPTLSLSEGEGDVSGPSPPERLS